MKHYEIDYAKVMIKQNESVSELNLDEIRIKDFDKYYQTHYQNQVTNGTISALPETLNWPVNEYKDRVYSFDSTDDHSVLLYVPQLPFNQFMTNQTKDQR